jgi:hypothetical protein
MNTRIRVIPADQNPRLAYKTPKYTDRVPPKLDMANFPPLPRPSILERLPMEIRELIWAHVMRAEDVGYSNSILVRYCVWRGDKPARPRFVPRLYFLSKATQDEILGVFLRAQTFAISSIWDNTFLRNYIASVQDGALHVRNLCFYNFDFFPNNDPTTGLRLAANSDLELAVDCPGLHTVDLTFGRRFLGGMPWDNVTQHNVFAAHTVEHVVDRYRLRRLLDCNMLHIIRLYGKDYGLGPVQVLQDLAD